MNRLSILSHPQRMEIFRLLMRRYPDALPVSEILSVLTIKPSTASVYLSALKSVGLIEQQRVGTSLLYRANIEAPQDIISELFSDCCGNRADICLPTIHNRPKKVLFLCTGNSARSIMAEAILNDLGRNFEVSSAGTAPRGAVHPAALEVLQQHGHQTEGLASKSLATLAPSDLDFAFTVCDSAANHDYGSLSGAPITSHWSTEDPVAPTSSTDDFQHAYEILRSRIHEFAALPFETASRTNLQQLVDNIALKIA
ncbi:helix-turn-helix domain-containing protein [Falsihalocynthiibacter sp. SS001]|uniref:arsenate reductase/protein-tyrosine-phosphatase family protein n=1 Tax=Falsihalocynthiibacter sp. SS001 TaxID=3349698 RepID=UPI0036D2647C